MLKYIAINENSWRTFSCHDAIVEFVVNRVQKIGCVVNIDYHDVMRCSMVDMC